MTFDELTPLQVKLLLAANDQPKPTTKTALARAAGLAEAPHNAVQRGDFNDAFKPLCDGGYFFQPQGGADVWLTRRGRLYLIHAARRIQ